MTKSNKQLIQESQYNYPYHFIPSLGAKHFSIIKSLDWGLEYVSYLEFVLKLIDQIRFNTLVDIGCGDGRLLNELNHKYKNKKLIGIDCSSRALQLAKAMTGPEISYLRRDIVEDSKKNRLLADIVVLMETLEHIPVNQVDLFVNAVSRYVKKNGTLLMTVPSDKVLLSPKHFQHFNLSMIKKKLSRNFKIREIYYINRTNNDIRVKLINIILRNNFFYLNNRTALTFLYSYYMNNLLVGEYSNSRRLLIIATRK